MAKRLSKTLWYGTGLDTYGKPLLPPVATNESDLNGLHRGELFMHLDKDNVTLWALSSNNDVVQIAGKQGEIDIDLSDYLLKSTWDKVWELRKDNNGVEYIYSKLPVITRYGITMYADNGEVEVESIYEGLPIDRQTLIWKDGVLMVNPELDLGNGGGIDENGLRDYLTRNDYAKKSDITTALSGYATTSSLNAVSTKLNDFLEGSDTDTVINKWKELETFLSGLTESDNLATILTGKADKSYVDTNFVTIAGTEDVTGLHNFVNGLKIGGLPITKKQDDVVYLDANLVVRGGITMYAENELDIPSILDSLPIASNTSLGIASFDSTYFSVDANGMVSLTSAPSSGASSLGELLNVDASIDATASVDRILYQPKGSSVWTWRDLPKDGVVGNYLPLSGGTLTGDLTFQNSNININSNRLLMSSENSYGKSSWRIYAYGPTVQFKETSNADWCLKLNNDNSINVNKIITSEGTNGRYSEFYYGGIKCYGTTLGGYSVGVSLYDNNGTFKQTIINAYGDGSTFNHIFIGGEYNKPWVKIDASANMLVKGGITMYSDQRKKTILNHVELSLKQIADAPLIEHYYNSDQDKTTHVGSIAQYWAGLNDWFCKLDAEGYYTMEIQNAALASAISIARHLEKYESKTDKKIRMLKKRVQELEDKLEKLEGGNYGNHS